MYLVFITFSFPWFSAYTHTHAVNFGWCVDMHTGLVLYCKWPTSPPDDGWWHACKHISIQSECVRLLWRQRPEGGLCDEGPGPEILVTLVQVELCFVLSETRRKEKAADCLSLCVSSQLSLFLLLAFTFFAKLSSNLLNWICSVSSD